MNYKLCKILSSEHAKYLVSYNKAMIRLYEAIAFAASLANIIVFIIFQNEMFSMEYVAINIFAYLLYYLNISLMRYVTKPIYNKKKQLLHAGWNIRNGGPGEVFKDIIMITAMCHVLSAYLLYLWWVVLLIPIRILWFLIEYYLTNRYSYKHFALKWNEKQIKRLNRKVMKLQRIYKLKPSDRQINKERTDLHREQKLDELLKAIQERRKQIQYIKELYERRLEKGQPKAVFVSGNQLSKMVFIRETKPCTPPRYSPEQSSDSFPSLTTDPEQTPEKRLSQSLPDVYMYYEMSIKQQLSTQQQTLRMYPDIPQPPQALQLPLLQSLEEVSPQTEQLQRLPRNETRQDTVLYV